MFYKQVEGLATEPFKRLTGVKPETFVVMVGAVGKMSTRKRKAGRPSKLSIEDQVLMTLMYLRENRTYFHIGHTYGINASTAYRTIRRVEDELSKVDAFKLPGKKQVLRGSFELAFVIVDVTETPIERPKKSSGTTTAAKRSATR